MAAVGFSDGIPDRRDPHRLPTASLIHRLGRPLFRIANTAFPVLRSAVTGGSGRLTLSPLGDEYQFAVLVPCIFCRPGRAWRRPETSERPDYGQAQDRDHSPHEEPDRQQDGDPSVALICEFGADTGEEDDQSELNRGQHVVVGVLIGL